MVALAAVLVLFAMRWWTYAQGPIGQMDTMALIVAVFFIPLPLGIVSLIWSLWSLRRPRTSPDYLALAFFALGLAVAEYFVLMR